MLLKRLLSVEPEPTSEGARADLKLEGDIGVVMAEHGDKTRHEVCPRRLAGAQADHSRKCTAAYKKTEPVAFLPQVSPHVIDCTSGPRPGPRTVTAGQDSACSDNKCFT